MAKAKATTAKKKPATKKKPSKVGMFMAKDLDDWNVRHDLYKTPEEAIKNSCGMDAEDGHQHVILQVVRVVKQSVVFELEDVKQ